MYSIYIYKSAIFHNFDTLPEGTYMIENTVSHISTDVTAHDFSWPTTFPFS